MDEPLQISCDTCVMTATSACEDCVVTFLCSREPDDAVVIDAAEWRALSTLRSAGLAPPLRHQARLG